MYENINRPQYYHAPDRILKNTWQAFRVGVDHLNSFKNKVIQNWVSV